MSRRIEIELTSERPDGIWTWRAAGAKQPKGELQGSLLPAGSKVGEVLRADADFAMDGIDIVAVLPPKAARKEPERLVVVGTKQDEPLITTQLAPKGKGGGRRDRGDRGDRGDRPRGDRRNDRDRGDRGGDRSRGDRPGGDRSRGPRPDPVPERPKPKRLRPGRANRSAVLDELPVEHRPIAEQVLRGGVPAVREAIAKQNEQAKKENRPEIPSDQLVALAEELLPRLRAAEWLDKAQSALSDIDELDLRDLRSVVVAADRNTRDDESKALLEQLQAGLTRRIDEEQTNWISDITANLDAGRFVRALRLSSRPPKAGAPLPPELATRLINAVSEGLTPTVNQDLWAAAVDALAFSPVRNQVAPAGRPAEPSEALIDAVTRVGDRLPKMVELFGLDPAVVAAAAKKRGRGGPRGGRDKAKGRKGDGPKGPKADAPKGDAAKGDAAKREQAKDEGLVVDPTETAVAATEAPSESAPSTEAEATDATTAETAPEETPPAATDAVEGETGAIDGSPADQVVEVDETVEVEVEGDGPDTVVVPADAEIAVEAEVDAETAAVESADADGETQTPSEDLVAAEQELGAEAIESELAAVEGDDAPSSDA